MSEEKKLPRSEEKKLSRSLKCKKRKWLENTETEIHHRISVLEEAQRDVNTRLSKLEHAVEQSLTSVHSCIDNLMSNLNNKEKEEAKNALVPPTKIKKEQEEYHMQEKESEDFPIHQAASNGDLSAVKAFVMAGANICTKNGRGQSTLQVAAAGGHYEIVKFLLEHAYSDMEDGLSSAEAREQLEQALMWAVGSPVTQLLIEKVGRNATAVALRRAAQEGRASVLRELLNTGVTAREVDTDGWSALHLAVEGGHTACVNALLEFGVKGGYVGGPKLQTPLHIAAEKGHAQCLETLLKRGCRSINVRDRNGWSALHYAAFGTSPECVKLLLEHGVNISLLNNRGETALHQAACLSSSEKDAMEDAPATLARRQKVLKLLLDAGANPNANSEDATTPLDQDGADALRQVMH